MLICVDRVLFLYFEKFGLHNYHPHSCIGLGSLHFGTRNFRVKIRTFRLDYIRVILFIFIHKLAQKTRFKRTKRENIQMFNFAFFLWFSANIVTRVIFSFCFCFFLRITSIWIPGVNMCIIIQDGNFKNLSCYGKDYVFRRLIPPALCSIAEQRHFE